MVYKEEKEVAIAAAKKAAILCEKVRQAKDSQTTAKPDASPVTIADFGSQAIICEALEKYFPNDPIIGEEDAGMLENERLDLITHYVQEIVPEATGDTVKHWINRGNGDIASRYWTLDPIDGTKGFIRGDQYAIALALVENGEVKVGVLACPALPVKNEGETGVLFVAVKGEGTTMMSLRSDYSQSIQVNSYTDSNSLRLIASVESAHSDRAQQNAILSGLNITQSTIHMDSQAKYGGVARGDADLYLRIPLPQDSSRRENIWDHAAGAIIVTEAGGKVTDLHGKPLDFSVGAKLEKNWGVVASNGAIHEQVLQIWGEMKK